MKTSWQLPSDVNRRKGLEHPPCSRPSLERPSQRCEAEPGKGNQSCCATELNCAFPRLRGCFPSYEYAKIASFDLAEIGRIAHF